MAAVANAKWVTTFITTITVDYFIALTESFIMAHSLLKIFFEGSKLLD